MSIDRRKFDTALHSYGEEFFRFLAQTLLLQLAKDRGQENLDLEISVTEDLYYSVDWDHIFIHESNDFQNRVKTLRIKDTRHSQPNLTNNNT